MIDESKLREWMAVAEAYGWRVASKFGWWTDDDLCCPMGAVIVGANGGVNPQEAGLYLKSDLTTEAARTLGCTVAEVRLFVLAFDRRRFLGRSDAIKLGRKLRAELDERDEMARKARAFRRKRL